METLAKGAHVKPVVLALLVAASLSACGGPCLSPYSGAWNGYGKSINLGAACDFQYSAANCSSAGTYAEPLGPSGNVAISITSTSGSGCMPVGGYSCGYAATSSSLAFDCGAGAETFSR